MDMKQRCAPLFLTFSAVTLSQYLHYEYKTAFLGTVSKRERLVFQTLTDVCYLAGANHFG